MESIEKRDAELFVSSVGLTAGRTCIGFGERGAGCSLGAVADIKKLKPEELVVSAGSVDVSSGLVSVIADAGAVLIKLKLDVEAAEMPLRASVTGSSASAELPVVSAASTSATTEVARKLNPDEPTDGPELCAGAPTSFSEDATYLPFRFAGSAGVGDAKNEKPLAAGKDSSFSGSLVGACAGALSSKPPNMA